MAKSLLYRLFKVGKFPDSLKAQLESEGILVQDEGVSSTVTYTNFHSPGRYAGWRRTWATASLAVTRTRFVAILYSRSAIDVPFADERFHGLNISLENADTLLVAFDASLGHNDWSGKIEYRFRTPEAQAFLDALRQQSA